MAWTSAKVAMVMASNGRSLAFDARLTRQVTPEIILALKKAGVRIVTADGGELGFADLVAHTLTITGTEIGDIVKQETK